MTPEKAIKFLGHIYDDRKIDCDLSDNLPGQKAIKLGIEALEFYKREKASNVSGIWSLLPGETEK